MSEKCPFLNFNRVFTILISIVSIFLLRFISLELKADAFSKVPSSEVSDYDGEKVKFSQVDPEYVAPGEDLGEDVLSTDSTISDLSMDQLLLESVISIIQGYYVDSHRVSNNSLYNLSLEVLTEIIPTHEDKKTSIVFIEKGKTYEVPKATKNFDYSSLINGFRVHHMLAQKVIAARGSKEQHVILRGVLEKLDAHSSMMMPEDYKELRQGTEGVFGGLGVMVGMRDQLLTVIQPIPRSPAYRAGISKDDKILSINGHNTYGSTLDQLVEHMRGAPGTKVDLRILTTNALAAKDVSIVREVIQVDSVTSKVIKHGVNEYLYLAIDSFASRTSEEISSALKKFRATHDGKLPGVVLDLRSNPGGLLDQAVEVSDLFIEKGAIVSTRGRKKEVENASYGEHETDFPMAVLINSESASASEILAGALQDHERALIIGQQSFGKGSVQTVFELPGQRAIKLTIARYYTPKGRTIQNTGIIPDVIFQPVYKRNTNINLLGDYRYRGEGALSHALESKSLINKNNSRALFESYYLADNPTTDFTSEEDFEFQLSKVFLNSVSKRYGKELPENFRRIGHLVSIASKEMNSFLSTKLKSVQSYLAKSYEVEWGGKSFQADDLSMQITSNERISVVPGRKAVIPIRIFNESSQVVNNVSVSIQTSEVGLMSREILIGKIEPKSTLSKDVEVDIPSFWQADIIDANIYLVVNGKIKTEKSVVKLDVKPRILANLTARVSLVGEKGGKALGKLEANEAASIVVEVENQSKTSSNATNLKLHNLSGSQISLPVKSLEDLVIAPGEKKKFYFDVQAGAELYDSQLSLGVFLDSSDLIEPYMKELMIMAKPGKASDITRQAFSH